MNYGVTRQPSGLIRYLPPPVVELMSMRHKPKTTQSYHLRNRSIATSFTPFADYVLIINTLCRALGHRAHAPTSTFVHLKNALATDPIIPPRGTAEENQCT